MKEERSRDRRNSAGVYRAHTVLGGEKQGRRCVAVGMEMYPLLLGT